MCYVLFLWLLFSVQNFYGMSYDMYDNASRRPLVRNDIVFDTDSEVATFFNEEMILLDYSPMQNVPREISLKTSLTSFLDDEQEERTAQVWSVHNKEKYMGIAGLRYICDKQASLQCYLKKTISDANFITLLDLIVVQALDTMKLKQVNICVDADKKRLSKIFEHCANTSSWKKDRANVWGKNVWYGISLSD